MQQSSSSYPGNNQISFSSVDYTVYEVPEEEEQDGARPADGAEHAVDVHATAHDADAAAAAADDSGVADMAGAPQPPPNLTLQSLDTGG